MVDLGVRAGHPLGVRRRAVAPRGALLGELAQPGHLVVARRARERRQARRDQLRGRTRTRAERGGPLDHAGVAGEAAGLLGPRAQVGAGRAGSQPSMSSRLRRARTAASAVASGGGPGVA